MSDFLHPYTLTPYEKEHLQQGFVMFSTKAHHIGKSEMFSNFLL